MTQSPAIQFEDVAFAYTEDAPVLDGVTFRIERGETLCLVGPNGGGKTTLLRLALGQLEPDRGSIRICGEAARQARQRIGYMPQQLDFDPLFPANAMDVVLMGRLDRVRLGGFYRKKDRDHALHCLEDVRLADCARRPFAELSGGQRQRVLIARAMAVEPEILLLDEPTASVDAAAGEQLFETLERLHQRVTLIMVSHDVAFVSKIVKRVLCVNRSVHMHSTEDLKPGAMHDLYGYGVRAVRHDHDLLEDAH